MKKPIATLLITLFVGSAATYGGMYYMDHKKEADFAARVLTMQQENVTLTNTLTGYTKYVDYMSITKTAIAERMKFLAAKVDRDAVQVHHVQKSFMKVKSDATVMVTYTVEYSVGYDLQPDSFSVSAEEGGIVVKLKRPELVASPAVKILSSEVVGTGLMIDEKQVVIDLQQKLPEVALAKGQSIPKDEAVVALCEKKLSEFLRDFLAKQPNVKMVPAIRFVYV